MAVFNANSFYKDLEASPAMRGIKRYLTELAEERFNLAKQEMIDDFLTHEVTIELQAGARNPAEAPNFSGTLDGKGNLFTFIGFEQGTKPIEIVEQALRKGTQFFRTTVDYRKKGDVYFYTFRGKVPTFAELEKLTPMPWEPGRSWLSGIERGISGLGAFIYWKKNLPNSRSGAGLQSTRQLRVATFKNISYISKILREFRENL
jgi:hypothetical protein